jgi:PAS domain S-box-containing protein
VEPARVERRRNRPEDLVAGHLAAIVDSSDDAIISKSLDGIILSWNTGAERLFGYSAAEAIGQPITILIPPDDSGEAFEILSRIRRGERVDHYETVRLRKDGRPVHVSLTVSPIRDPGGAIIGASKIARDITERKTAELTMLQLAAIVASSDDAIIGKRLDGIIASWNAGAERLYQYAADEVVGRHISILVPSDQPDELPDIMARLRRGERIEHYETQRIRKDGTRIHVSVTISPVRNAAGEIIGASAIARDISQRRRLEEERGRLLEEERELHAATQRARREAEAASRAKDEFLAMVSHELRSPLNAIAGWLHILRVKRDDPALFDRALTTVDRNTRLLAKVVDDLLEASRIVAGQIRVNRQPVDIPPIVETVLDTMRPVAAEKGVVLESTMDPWAGPALGEPERLHQIIGNIVGNAIKFTPSGGRVDVRVRNDAAHVEIVISDTGRGIPAEFLPHVFEAFRQADADSSRAHGGLGLGLAIVHHLVKLHEGTVKAESPGVGKGARFTVRLPRLRDEGIGPPVL